MLREVDRQLPDYPVIMRVRAVGDTGHVLLQSNNRGHDVVARGNGLSLTVGDEVLVVQLARGQLPVVIGQSPWSVHTEALASAPTTNEGIPWVADDIVDFDAAVSANPAVAANLAASHDQLHPMTGTTDHTGVTDAPTKGECIAWNGSAWESATITMVLHGGTWDEE